jgi:RNA polymerase-associated protein
MSLRAKSKYVPPSKPAANAGLTLFCTADAVACLWVRLVLAEKDVDGARLQLQKAGRPSEDLALLNPTHTLPTLADRDTVIYPARVIAEYLDERYPHPPMMPPDPAQRARLRMVLDHVEAELFPLTTAAESNSAAGRDARQRLGERLLASTPLFAGRGWLLGGDFSLLDCAWTAVFWRVAALRIDLPPSAEPLRRYVQRAFARPAVARTVQPR